MAKKRPLFLCTNLVRLMHNAAFDMSKGRAPYSSQTPQKDISFVLEGLSKSCQCRLPRTRKHLMKSLGYRRRNKRVDAKEEAEKAQHTLRVEAKKCGLVK